MAAVLDILSWILLIAGSFFCVVGAIGLILVRHAGVNADPMTNRELDPVAVQHLHPPLLRAAEYPGVIVKDRSLAKYRRSVRSSNDQLWLEYPC